jgi:hypothetical protein
MQWQNYDRTLGVGFRLGQRRHGVRIRRGARKMLSTARARSIYRILAR